MLKRTTLDDVLPGSSAAGLSLGSSKTAGSNRVASASHPRVIVVIIALDNHLASAAVRAGNTLRQSVPGLELRLHAASEWAGNPASLSRCLGDIEEANFIIATMLFMEEHIKPVLPALTSRRNHCDALLAIMAEGDVVRLTRLGRFDMQAGSRGPIGLLKRLRGKSNAKDSSGNASRGASQMKMLRRIPRMLRYIPGTAQDMRAYFLGMQYWLSGSQQNLEQLIRMLIDRYADGPRRALRGNTAALEPVEYPEIGAYHPTLKEKLTEDRNRLPGVQGARGRRVGLLLMRSYLLAGNTDHYDAVIESLESRGLVPIPVFASGLDARPAIEKFFIERSGEVSIDAMISLTGFSLVGGPAYNDTAAAQEMLERLDVPFIAALPLEFQTLQQWRESDLGLTPIETTMMVAIPELDGSTVSSVFGGTGQPAGPDQSRVMTPDTERIARLSERVSNLIKLRAKPVEQQQIAIVLFCFPPNAGNIGTAAHLSVFSSLFNLLKRLQSEGYRVELPESVDALREQITGGNAGQYGTPANVHDHISVDHYIRSEPHLAEIEAAWGPAPGRLQSNGAAIQVYGARFGNVMIGIQPGFGYEGDPMRLLFEKGFAPTHAFSAFYRYLREDFGADALLHFGTHGALEFMPGKQVGLSDQCWPERLIGAVPNFYLYAANNPSEGLIAKRRSAATLLSYLTPPLTHAGLYQGLADLKETIAKLRELNAGPNKDCGELVSLLQAQAASLDLIGEQPQWTDESIESEISALADRILELETTLVPDGLHVLGETLSESQRLDWIRAIAGARGLTQFDDSHLSRIVSGQIPPEKAGDNDALAGLLEIDRHLTSNDEIGAVVRALAGRFIRPAPGGDLIRNADILPTGRNIHGFDPCRIPNAIALHEGAAQAEQVLSRMHADRVTLPETIAMVLWGSDNLKTGGTAIAQALALIGARPRFDSYGRLAGAELIDLETLGRPRIDVVMTLSGIFRDLLPQQCKLLAQACHLAGTADEPPSQNFIRKHVLEAQQQQGVALDVATLRVFTNAHGAYGSNVNQLIESSRWDGEDELANTYKARKSHAFDHTGHASAQSEQLDRLLVNVDAAYQNLDSVELGVTTIDHYFDTLGGISSAARRASGQAVPVYIADHTTGRTGAVRSLNEQIELESRTRVLNPKWHESMLAHGYEGVHQIEMHVTNTMGWSATTGQVAPWVYKQISQTFVLDDAMRERLTELNPTAGLSVANRLLEAHDRKYWEPDSATLQALRDAADDLEDRIEGICKGVAV